MPSDQFPQREQTAMTLGRARRLRYLAQTLERRVKECALNEAAEDYLQAAMRKYAEASVAFEDLGRTRAARRCADRGRDCALALVLLSRQ